MTPRIPTLSTLATLLALATVSGCDGSGSSPKVTSFTVTPEVVPSLGGDVLLTWNVKNASEIEIDPLVGVVTGTSATVHVTETTTFTLTAKQKGRAARKRRTVTLGGPGAITGLVRRPLSREPIPNIAVWIKGQGATYTAADGSFSFENIDTPYDIAVVDAPTSRVTIYLGVTRSDPTLEMDLVAGISYAVGNVSGSLTPVLPVGSANNVYFDGPTRATDTFPSANAYNQNAGWLGPDPADFTIRALRWTVDTAGNPSAYTGYGETPVIVTDTLASVADVALAPTTTEETTGTVSFSSTATLLQARGFVVFGTPLGSNLDESFFFPTDTSASSPDGSFSLLSPAFTGALTGANLYGRFTVSGIGGSAFATVLLTPGASDVAIDLPAPPRLLSPISGGSVSRDTVLRSATRSDSVKVFALGPTLIVVTTESEFVIPDLREIGYDLFENGPFLWYVDMELAPRASVDEAAGPDGLAGASPEWLGFSDLHALYPTATP